MALDGQRKPKNSSQLLWRCIALCISISASCVCGLAQDGRQRQVANLVRQSTMLGDDLPTVPAWYHQTPQRSAAAGKGSARLSFTTSQNQTKRNAVPAVADQTAFWWQPIVAQSLRPESNPSAVDVIGLMQAAVQNSCRVVAVEQTQWIRAQDAVAAIANLDPTIYATTRFDDTSDPVGDLLTTGGPDRLVQRRWAMDAGLRGTTGSGATYSLGQQLGHLNNNSTFINPNDQGTARLGAAINQPLLRNRRIDANRSLIVTTRLETDAARAQYLATVSEQLGRIGDIYWKLYFARATLVQRQRHLDRGRNVAMRLEARRALDSAQSQILRARAAVASREATLARTEAKIRNLENELRTLINLPGLSDRPNGEIIPVQSVTRAVPNLNVELEVARALATRPELMELGKQISMATVQLELARNRLQPELNLILEGYLAGLEGGSNVPGAWAEQFSEGRPSYAGGFEFEAPYRNRAAQAAVRQQQFVLVRLQNLLAERRANIRAEVENAVRVLEASGIEARGRKRSLASTGEELEYQQLRWEKLKGDERLAQFQLDELLGTQDRLFQEEQSLLQALTDLNRSIIDVQVATGALVQLAR
ncbi:MAG TPA: hypothetical protein DDW52_02915 [Planctomycetaceae bacterium]|nr:hypothetical protein [Planctomycetaceae bacterium]